jgi:hypothetical protein
LRSDAASSTCRFEHAARGHDYESVGPPIGRNRSRRCVGRGYRLTLTFEGVAAYAPSTGRARLPHLPTDFIGREPRLRDLERRSASHGS